MQISDLDQEIYDFEWFALDKEGLVGHFATGGCGAMPTSVASSRENLRKVTDFFRNMCSAKSSTQVSQELDEHVDLKNSAAAREVYLRSYVEMASRGLFSYDCMRSPKRPTGYFLVAKPLTPLQVSSLPHEISEILGIAIFEDVSFREARVIGLIKLQ
jgi:hypothetical protein